MSYRRVGKTREKDNLSVRFKRFHYAYVASESGLPGIKVTSLIVLRLNCTLSLCFWLGSLSLYSMLYFTVYLMVTFDSNKIVLLV